MKGDYKMTTAEKERIKKLLDFIQDKVEDVYAKETQKAIDRYLKEIDKK